jgi:hypothetical protein
MELGPVISQFPVIKRQLESETHLHRNSLPIIRKHGGRRVLAVPLPGNEHEELWNAFDIMELALVAAVSRF